MQILIPYLENEKRNLLHMLQVFLAIKKIKINDFPKYMSHFRSGNTLAFKVEENDLEFVKKQLNSMEVVYQLVK